ncbi:MAG TPA: hypothetical protein VNQ76_16855 [Planctomicrobium sp.]|nr:hypothetical protein [Planctomicrobium sp.]
MRKILIITCAVAMVTLTGLPNISEAANPRRSFNQGYRTGVRTTNRVYRNVVPRTYYNSPRGYYNYNRGYYAPRGGYYNRGYYGGNYGRGYYGRGYYGRPGLYLQF